VRLAAEVSTTRASLSAIREDAIRRRQ
jgi:hypothetical protein